MKKIITPLLISAFIGFSMPVSADVLLLDAISAEPPNAPAGVMRPSRGMSMQTVKDRFGAPDAEHGPVGEPPITRWDYGMYSVFFEHNLVLNTVIHRR